MARLPKGQSPEPRAQRLQRYRDELEMSGGQRVIVDLDGQAANALTQIRNRDTAPDATRPMTIKDAISHALVHYAKLARGRS